jgi:hypothetical protein
MKYSGSFCSLTGHLLQPWDFPGVCHLCAERHSIFRHISQSDFCKPVKMRNETENYYLPMQVPHEQNK